MLAVRFVLHFSQNSLLDDHDRFRELIDRFLKLIDSLLELELLLFARNGFDTKRERCQLMHRSLQS